MRRGLQRGGRGGDWGCRRVCGGWEEVAMGQCGVKGVAMGQCGVRLVAVWLRAGDEWPRERDRGGGYVRINYVMTDYITVHGSLTSCDVTQSNECSGRPHAGNTDKKKSLSVY